MKVLIGIDNVGRVIGGRISEVLIGIALMGFLAFGNEARLLGVKIRLIVRLVKERIEFMRLLNPMMFIVFFNILMCLLTK